MAKIETKRLSRRNPKFLVMVHITVRGDTVQWFRELHKRCQEDEGFRKLYLANPMKALFSELSRDVWHHVPSEEFESRFDAALRKKGDIKLDSMRGPFNAKSILKLAERISTDKRFADAFRKDTVGQISRAVGRVPSGPAGAWCKITSSHNVFTCETEIDFECGTDW